jgi:hypothetical protein
LKTACGERAVEQLDGVWLCEPHAASARLALRAAGILAQDFDDEG